MGMVISISCITTYTPPQLRSKYNSKFIVRDDFQTFVEFERKVRRY